MYILGVDPGKTGSATLITTTAKLHEVICFADTTAMDRLYQLCRMFQPTAYMEKVHAMPGQGVSSMFTFGYHTGRAECAVTIAGVPLRHFAPQQWQRILRLPEHWKLDDNKQRPQRRKDQEKLARAIYPELNGFVDTKIAEYKEKGASAKDAKAAADCFASVLIARAGLMDAYGLGGDTWKTYCEKPTE